MPTKFSNLRHLEVDHDPPITRVPAGI
eukprot:SAG11_NODE_8030_length_1067_cov_1.161157_3_plen_26_part_01